MLIMKFLMNENFMDENKFLSRKLFSWMKTIMWKISQAIELEIA